MNSAQLNREAPALPPTGTKRSREVAQIVCVSRKRRNTLATTIKQTYGELSSPESPYHPGKQLQTTDPQKTKPTSRESRPKPGPSPEKQSAPTPTGKGTPAGATPGTIKKFGISAETVKSYEIVRKDGFKAFLKSIIESFRLAAQAGKFKMTEDHEVGPLIARILEAVVSAFDFEVPYM